jgi:hypothetical protein
MLPCFSTAHTANGAFASSKIVAKLAEGNVAGRISLASNANIVGSQNGAAARFATGTSALVNSIGNIGGNSSEKQMLGIDTRRSVAAMQNKHPIRYRPVGTLVSDPMCHQELPSWIIAKDFSISVIVVCPRPEQAPTLGWRSDILRKTLFKRDDAPDLGTGHRAVFPVPPFCLAGKNGERTFTDFANSCNASRLAASHDVSFREKDACG